MIIRKKPWKAIGHLHANEEGSAWLLARPMNVLSGWPNAIRALWMTSMAFSISAQLESVELHHTHPAVVAFETLSLPDGHVHGVDAIADTGDGSREDHLNVLRRGCLEYGTDNHDPASPHDTAFAAKAIRGEECDDRAEKTSDVIDACNDALKISIWVVELFAERGEADDGSQDSLVISEELDGHC